MSRASRDLDKKLMLVGQALIQEVGVSKLSLREVARLADVNLGMINYYFEGKDDFVLKVLLEVYRPFIEELERISEQINEKQGFENFLFELAKFSRDNRKLILLLIKDIISDDPIVKKFIFTHFIAHFKLLKKTLEVKIGTGTNVDAVLRFVIASIGMPNLILGFQEMMDSSPKKIESSESSESSESNEELRKRVRITMEGLNNFINS